MLCSSQFFVHTRLLPTVRQVGGKRPNVPPEKCGNPLLGIPPLRWWSLKTKLILPNDTIPSEECGLCTQTPQLEEPSICLVPSPSTLWNSAEKSRQAHHSMKTVRIFPHIWGNRTKNTLLSMVHMVETRRYRLG